MRYVFLFVCMWILGLIPVTVEAAFARNLKVGDRGSDVRELQVILNKDPDTYIALFGPGSPGQETDYFGARTSDAVIRFQNKYREDVLGPAGLTIGTGYVGALTRAKLFSIIQSIPPLVQSASNSTTTPVFMGFSTTTPGSKKVVIDTIKPTLVRSGDMVTITGEGFTPTGNTIEIGSGLLVRTFENVPSTDGKTITFRYEAPIANTMTLEELRALPSDVLSQIENPAKAAGVTLEDIVRPYKGMKNETDLAVALAKNGKTLRDLDDLFHVTVTNSNGSTENPRLLLRAARHITFEGGISGFLKNTRSKLFSHLSPVPQKTHAQLAGGGLNASIVMVCTCGGGTLNILAPFGGGGGGLTYFAPGFVPITGSTMPGGFYLGLFTPGSGVCSIYAGYSCFTIMGSLPTLYGQNI